MDYQNLFWASFITQLVWGSLVMLAVYKTRTHGKRADVVGESPEPPPRAVRQEAPRKHEKPKMPETVAEMESVYYDGAKRAELAAWKFKGNVDKAVEHLKKELEKKTGIMYEVPA